MSGPSSLPKSLHDLALQRVIEHFSLVEVLSENDQPYMTLESQLPMHQGQCGVVRVFKDPADKPALFQVVSISITVPAMQLDSHMMFAFTPSDNALPHFTVDSVRAGDHLAFHLDLIPRLDLGANLAYMQQAYEPLTECFQQGQNIEGLTPAELSPTQLALMSPWMLASRATDEAFVRVEKTVSDYLEHWLGLMESGLSDEAVRGASSATLIERDKNNKFAIFNKTVDPVWARIEPLIGTEAATRQIELLRAVSE